MNKLTPLYLFFVLFLYGCTNKELPPTKLPIDRVKWHDYSTGLQKALSQDKNIFLSVHADWCHPCHIVEAEVYNDSSVANYLNDSLIAIKVDYEGDSPLACGGNLKDAKLCLEEDWKEPQQISALPFFAILNPKGHLIVSRVGKISQAEILLLLMEMKEVLP